MRTKDDERDEGNEEEEKVTKNNWVINHSSMVLLIKERKCWIWVSILPLQGE